MPFYAPIGRICFIMILSSIMGFFACLDIVDLEMSTISQQQSDIGKLQKVSPPA